MKEEKLNEDKSDRGVGRRNMPGAGGTWPGFPPCLSCCDHLAGMRRPRRGDKEGEDGWRSHSGEF